MRAHMFLLGFFCAHKGAIKRGIVVVPQIENIHDCLSAASPIATGL